MRISDWSSDVCSSDLVEPPFGQHEAADMLRQVARRLQQFADEAVQPLDLAIVRIEPGLNEAPGRHLLAPASPARIGKPRGHILAETERLADLANRAAPAVVNDGARDRGAPAPRAAGAELGPRNGREAGR